MPKTVRSIAAAHVGELTALVAATVLIGALYLTSSDAPPTPTAIENQQTAEEPEHPLSSEEAGRELADFVGQKFAVLREMMGTLDRRIKATHGLVVRRDRPGFVRLAEAMEADVSASQERLVAIGPPPNLAEADQPAFDAVENSAAALSGEALEVAATFGILAHTGLFDDEDARKTMQAYDDAKLSFVASVLAAYRHFGLSPERIDKTTLRPKAGRLP